MQLDSSGQMAVLVHSISNKYNVATVNNTSKTMIG